MNMVSVAGYAFVPSPDFAAATGACTVTGSAPLWSAKNPNVNPTEKCDQNECPNPSRNPSEDLVQNCAENRGDRQGDGGNAAQLEDARDGAPGQLCQLSSFDQTA